MRKRAHRLKKSISKRVALFQRKIGSLDFDDELYLAVYADVRQAGVDPFKHWLEFGRAEGRHINQSSLTSVQGVEKRRGGRVRDPSRPTVLIVSHEASRTGAPILALNVAQQLHLTHNVVSLVLRDGPLIENFAEVSTNIYVASEKHLGAQAIAGFIVPKEVSGIDFAIVNSVVSYPSLAGIKYENIPVIYLIHEFISYVKPFEIFEEIVESSKEIVFSARIIADDALRNCKIHEFRDDFSYRLLPQGRCDVPKDTRKTEEVEADVGAQIRGVGNERVIVGAGSVDFRKGVDLFLQAARCVLDLAPGVVWRFVWVGKGFDPKKDAGFSVYLDEQIKRSGLEHCVEFIGEVSNIDSVYKNADALWLTSRLDPLPNVGIDAICEGLPIFCFANASGIADILQEDGFQELVAPYMSTALLAKQTIDALTNEVGLLRIRAQLKKTAVDRFDIKRYSSQLVEIGESLVR